ncbi:MULTISPECIES: hypothetical protein [unclassified Rhizobium]|uniref:hypothetical protein n=1 Tax=unclassified Rhizobium TaxID=2613769 RepID=UPI0012E3EB89|nr:MULTISPECIES: hypothetical protein [unclassified Rhizobium]
MRLLWQAAQSLNGLVRFSRLRNFAMRFGVGGHKKTAPLARRGLNGLPGRCYQPTLRVRTKPSGPKGADITTLRSRDWFAGTTEFHAIWTKLGLLKMNNIGL